MFVTPPYRFISCTLPSAGHGTATLTLNRPETGNAIDAELAEEFRHACGLLNENDRCRLLVVAAAGNCFSVGRQPLGNIDPAAPGEFSTTGAADAMRPLQVADALAALNIPVIVALNGDAIGHGLELALAGDLRIAATNARFALSGPGMPAFPWDGGTQRLPRLIGPAWALDLALTGRAVAAEPALTLGLVNRVVPPDLLLEETERLADSILAGGPIAARYVKEAVNHGLDLTLHQGLQLESDLSLLLHSTADRAEGIASFREKRPPRFIGS